MTATSGSLFIISAPSGTGKTSLVRALLRTNVGLNLSISYTSRLPRAEEINGRDYHFVTREVFEQMLECGEFQESAEVYGNYYGTSQKWINEATASGQDILLEIDSQGAQQVRRAFPNAVGIFILPPSLAMLETRLRNRGQDSSEIIARRVAAAREEISHVSEYDYVIINEELDAAISDFFCIVRAERMRMAKQLIRYHHLLTQLK